MNQRFVHAVSLNDSSNDNVSENASYVRSRAITGKITGLTKRTRKRSKCVRRKISRTMMSLGRVSIDGVIQLVRVLLVFLRIVKRVAFLARQRIWGANNARRLHWSEVLTVQKMFPRSGSAARFRKTERARR